MSADYHQYLSEAQWYEDGRADMLRQVLEEAETFRGLMIRRRYFNNAAGVGRLVEYLKGKFAPTLARDE